MSKWPWIAGVMVALGGAGIYWYLDVARPVRTAPLSWDAQPLPSRAGGGAKHDGNAEASDVFEPLVVEGGAPDGAAPTEPARQPESSRVVFEPGMQQPPRPDAEPGTAPRMPYADEEYVLDLTPLLQILDATLPRLHIFERFKEAIPADDLEDPDEMPPAELDPAAEYHRLHPHCPYMGGYPYRR